MKIIEKISLLRSHMQENQIAAVIIPSSDPHQSEYIADCWKDREWMSGFTGSAGTLVIGMDFAGLWTDSRYFLQAESELKGSGIQLMKLKNQFHSEFAEYLVGQLPKKSKVAIDGWDISVSQYNALISLFSTKQIELIANLDLVSCIWHDRPSLPFSTAIDHGVNYCGESRISKIERIRKILRDEDVDATLLTALDDIAWTFNIRGNDVSCNPVLVSYAFIDSKNAILFIDDKKLPETLRISFSEENITVKPYESIIEYLNNLNESNKIAVDPKQCNCFIYKAVNGIKVEIPSIPKYLKAIKNDTEIANLKNAMIKDGVALANAFYELEQKLSSETITEAELASILSKRRAEQEAYQGESFDAIVGYNANGAIIHYKPDPVNSTIIKDRGILLVDSGGQYLDGTTDITRTFALSDVPKTVKKQFTLVLKGMIALSEAVFPKGTKGGQLDLLARQFLWQEGLNYGHGTGHGVGFFLNVHEPPQGFAALNTERGNTVMEPGMLSSNEPGFYLPGEYGMRIENLILCKVHPQHPDYLCFETVTLYPIDKNMIDYSLLTKSEVEWLNAYHKEVFEKLGPRLNDSVRSWLADKCSKISL